MSNTALIFAVYWRTLLVLVLLILAGAFIQQFIHAANWVRNTNVFRTLFWFLITSIYVLFLWLMPKGLIHFLWGAKLNLCPLFWRTFNMAIIAMFLSLLVLPLIVYSVSSKDVWGYYKLYFQPLVLLIVPIFCIKQSLKQAQALLAAPHKSSIPQTH
jgi:intracellular septation protein A